MAGEFTNTDKLYQLLPSVYRERDAQEGYPLRALLRIIEEQADILHADIQKLWDNFFVETCDPWVIPYIGRLVGNNLLYDASRFADEATAEQLFGDLRGPSLRPEMAGRCRADVAKTIYYRRRKGTAPMLEELARDVTGWASHAVEFFQGLGWTQHLNHRRPAATDCVELRHIEPLDRLDGPFDVCSHVVDARPPTHHEGWHNIPNIGFFLWRLRSYALEKVRARPGDTDWQYFFSPLGTGAPLFHPWRREGDEAGLATEFHAPGPMRPAYLYQDLEAYGLQAPPRGDTTGIYAPLDQGGSFHIERNELAVHPAVDPAAAVEDFEARVQCRRLMPWPAAQPSGPIVAVDPEHGRIAVGDGWSDDTDRLDVSYHYAFAADLGGGPYERDEWLVDPDLAEVHLHVQQLDTPADDDYFAELGLALDAWVARGKLNTIITIHDHRTYEESLEIEPADDAWLVIEAASGARPHLLPVGGEIRISGEHDRAAVTLSGLLIEGSVSIQGSLGKLRLLHSTLVPRRAADGAGTPLISLTAATTSGDTTLNGELRVEVAYSILGPMRLPRHATGLWLLDCIVDGLDAAAVAATGTDDQAGPPATLERVTILGSSHFGKLPLASDVIFTGQVFCEQTHEGCVRFSYVPPESRTPRRYRCQPDAQTRAAIERAKQEAAAAGLDLDESDLARIRASVQRRMVPGFTSKDYGSPAYCQLSLASPIQIRAGADDGSEMGAFGHLKQPQRETNLRVRLEEYLPFGLQPGLIFVT